MNQELFEYFRNEHDLILLENELQTIVDIVLREHKETIDVDNKE